MKRLLLIPLVLLVCVTGCGAKKKQAVAPPPPPTAGFPITPPVPAPSFLLRDQSNRRVGPQLEYGHWTVVTFLYTRCPDVCPLITSRLASAQRQNADLRVVAISVDPAHDTIAAIRKFLAAHHTGPRFHYTTGTRHELMPVWSEYHIAAQSGPQGTVSHSAYNILVDPKGRERVLFDAQVTTQDLLSTINRLS